MPGKSRLSKETWALSQGSGASIKSPDGTVQSTADTGPAQLPGGDYAESVDVLGEKSAYEVGDIMVLDPDMGEDVTKSTGHPLH